MWGALFGAPLAGVLQAVGTAAWRKLRGGDAQAVVQAVVAQEKQKGAEEELVTDKQHRSAPVVP